MNIIYIAYSCSPFHGSEDKIGWNIPIESAKSNKVIVITKEEQRGYIEEYLRCNPLENISFHYVDIPNAYKKMFSGALYSGRLNIWNKHALKLVKDICAKEQIDIIHQITPVEFRSIGNYGKIPGVKFVCGPVGGAEHIPTGLVQYAYKNIHIEIIRNIVNVVYKFFLKHGGILKNCDMLLFANRETKEYLVDCIKDSSVGFVESEIGISSAELLSRYRTRQEMIRFLVVGRMIYRKGHQLLLDAFHSLPRNMVYECVFVGEGTEYEALRKRVMCDKTLSNRIFFAGNIPYENMEKEYGKSSVLIMPSIRETTGTVVLEAMAKGLPVITIDKFGASTIVDCETGWLYTGDTKHTYIENLKSAIVECIESPEEVNRRGNNARKKAANFVWEKKNEHYQELYKALQN